MSKRPMCEVFCPCSCIEYLRPDSVKGVSRAYSKKEQDIAFFRFDAQAGELFYPYWQNSRWTDVFDRSQPVVYLEYQAIICLCGRGIYKRKGGKYSSLKISGLKLTECQINNEVVIWDRIIRRKRDAKLNIESARAKYSLRDPSLTFR